MRSANRPSGVLRRLAPGVSLRVGVCVLALFAGSAPAGAEPSRIGYFEQLPEIRIDHIDKKREALGIMGERERVLMDMADRQALEVEAGKD